MGDHICTYLYLFLQRLGILLKPTKRWREKYEQNKTPEKDVAVSEAIGDSKDEGQRNDTVNGVFTLMVDDIYLNTGFEWGEITKL